MFITPYFWNVSHIDFLVALLGSILTFITLIQLFPLALKPLAVIWFIPAMLVLLSCWTTQNVRLSQTTSWGIIDCGQIFTVLIPIYLFWISRNFRQEMAKFTRQTPQPPLTTPPQPAPHDQ